MDRNYKEMCEDIDAGIFIGELLCEPESIVEFKQYLDRWTRETNAKIKEMERESKG